MKNWGILIPLIGLAWVVYLGRGDEVTIRGLDSNIHATVARATVSGPGLLPVVPAPVPNEYSWGSRRRSPEEEQRLRDLTGTQAPHVFNDHPITLFVLQGWAMKLLGWQPWSARLPTAFFAVGTVAVLYLLGMAISSPALGLAAALIFLATREFVVSSVAVSLDPPLVFFTLLAFLLWKKGRWKWAAVASGAGFWIKTPVSLLVLPVALLWELRHKEKGAVSRFAVGLGIALGVGALYWSLIWLRTGSGDVFRDYWWGQVGRTIVEGRMGGEPRPLQFPHHLLSSFWPWLPLVGLAGFQALRRRALAPALEVSLWALGVMAVVFAPMKSTLNHYFLPAFPFLALMAAVPLESWIKKSWPRWQGGVWGAALLAALVAGVTPIPFAPEFYPGLKRFAPYIQATGTCGDEIAWVGGGEPWGGTANSVFWLNFMTGRRVHTVSCEELTQRAQAPHLSWVILTDQNLEHCKKIGALQHHSKWVRFGNQQLHFRNGSAPLEGDLTPLLQEGKAAPPCLE
jgi:hypothetical protein